MPYTPFQDGTQVFAIPDSPISINSVSYIAEAIQITHPGSVVEIKDEDGIPTGQVIIPENAALTATLQKASSSTTLPLPTNTFSLQGATWILTEVGDTYTQGQYSKANISARRKINP